MSHLMESQKLIVSVFKLSMVFILFDRRAGNDANVYFDLKLNNKLNLKNIF